VTATSGYPVVLTADRTLMARYETLLDGMMAASQTTTTPWPVMRGLLMPPTPHRDGRAVFAPLGLRRVEAALLAGGFGAEEVIVVAPERLATVVGPATRVIGVSTGEPLGGGMSSSTMAAVAGGRIFPEALFAGLMRRVRAAVAGSAPEARVVVGGPGAWQLAQDPARQQQIGADHVVYGYAEGNVAEVVRTLLEGASLPPSLAGENAAPHDLPATRGASTMGVVEISRGCGLGCGFCTLARVPMTDLPLETILADARTNLAAGLRGIAALSEDLFRYGGQGVRCNPPAVVGLLEALSAVEGLELIQVDHCNISSVAQFTDGELARVGRLLTGAHPRRPWVNLGVETASGRLLRASGGAAKMGATPDDAWGGVCREQITRLVRAGFTPMVSLVLGLPQDTPEDTRQTLEWVRSLRGQRLTIFPVIYAPLPGDPAPVLTPEHWQVMREAYEFNFRNMPGMIWGDQTAAGVAPGKRLALQALGRGQVVMWRQLLRRRRRESAA
jgi:radical SAM superfamily enzyme YgiQ (UPF0313 family)